MEISISEEQEHLISLATKSSLPCLIETGNLFPTLFIHESEQVRYFEFAVGSGIDELRESVRSALAQANAVAYALAYDSSLESDGTTNDALCIETCDADDQQGIVLAMVYCRDDGSHSNLEFVGYAEKLLP